MTRKWKLGIAPGSVVRGMAAGGVARELAQPTANGWMPLRGIGVAHVNPGGDVELIVVAEVADGFGFGEQVFVTAGDSVCQNLAGRW